MKILLIVLSTFLTTYSAQALSCYNCAAGTTLSGCVTGHVTESCATDTGFDHCFTIKTYVTKSDGQQVMYLEKQCGLAFVCNHPDPKFICSAKNSSYSGQGDFLHNCTWRCCTTDMCNNDDLGVPVPTAVASTPVTLAPTPSPSVNGSVNGSVTVSPTSPRNELGSTPTTPPGCGVGSFNKPMRMFITIVALYQLHLAYFTMM